MGVVRIYSLEDPITNEIRYIGKTCQSLQERYWDHLCDKSKTHKVNWLKSLKKQNLKPIIQELEQVPEDEWAFWECYWISQMKVWGVKLTNGDNGGTGKERGYIHSDETKIKLSKIRKANPVRTNSFNSLARKKQLEAVTGNIFRKGKSHKNYEAVRQSKLRNGTARSVSNGHQTFLTGWDAAKYIISLGKSKGKVSTVYNKVYTAIKRRGTAYGYKWEFVKFNIEEQCL